LSRGFFVPFDKLVPTNLTLYDASMTKDASTHPATVLVAVTGGIAAYKSVDLVSRLKKAGHDVHVLMSKAATEFVTPLTFAAISGHPVIASLFPAAAPEDREQAYPHLYPATRADVFIVAPATADMIARLARGEGDDVISTSALSLPVDALRFFAPAMNVEMWNQPVVRENVAALEKRGWISIGPEAGELACGMTGEGRMSEPEAIARVVDDAWRDRGKLSGKKVLILSGPTCEYLDPVRFISNASSGLMGKALALRAAAMGADVHFISGPVADANLPRHNRVAMVSVVSADDMLAAATGLYRQCDIVVFAAAVADYRPVSKATEKMRKQASGLHIELAATPDIAATLNQQKQPGQLAIGFALQTGDGEKAAREKLAAKRFDAIVLNAPEALGAAAAHYRFFSASGESETWGFMEKSACAHRVFDFAASSLPPSKF
jgi:phosphopantothenoylcysteine decarboxylase/phosphopantothenate--cysteine ligase